MKTDIALAQAKVLWQKIKGGIDVENEAEVLLAQLTDEQVDILMKECDKFFAEQSPKIAQKHIDGANSGGYNGGAAIKYFSEMSN